MYHRMPRCPSTKRKFEDSQMRPRFAKVPPPNRQDGNLRSTYVRFSSARPLNEYLNFPPSLPRYSPFPRCHLAPRISLSHLLLEDRHRFVYLRSCVYRISHAWVMTSMDSHSSTDSDEGKGFERGERERERERKILNITVTASSCSR